MRIARFVTVFFGLLVFSNCFGACAANVGLPRGAITSSHTCEDEGDCVTWDVPDCYKNIEFCYKGLCAMKKMAGCNPAVQ